MILEIQLAVIRKIRELYPNTQSAYAINTRRYR